MAVHNYHAVVARIVKKYWESTKQESWLRPYTDAASAVLDLAKTTTIRVKNGVIEFVLEDIDEKVADLQTGIKSITYYPKVYGYNGKVALVVSNKIGSTHVYNRLENGDFAYDANKSSGSFADAYETARPRVRACIWLWL
jgi:hypothetical protein